MNDRRLNQLLRQAGREDAALALPNDLADRVRRRMVHRRRRRRVVGGSVFILATLGAVAVWQLVASTSRVGIAHQAPVPRSSSTKGPGAPLRSAPATQDTTSADPDSADPTDTDVAVLQARIAQLQEEVARLTAQIEADAARRESREHLASLRRECRRPDPRHLALAEIEKTAFLGVYRAEACERRNRTEAARQEYEQVIKLFPRTSWAKVAQARLNRKPSDKGEE